MEKIRERIKGEGDPASDCREEKKFIKGSKKTEPKKKSLGWKGFHSWRRLSKRGGSQGFGGGGLLYFGGHRCLNGPPQNALRKPGQRTDISMAVIKMQGLEVTEEGQQRPDKETGGGWPKKRTRA